MSENDRKTQSHECCKPNKHAYSYSTIAIGDDPLPHSETTALKKSKSTSTHQETEAGWRVAVRAAQEKQAKDIRVLDLTGVTSFTDHFVICTGANTRQNQAITDEIARQLKQHGQRASSVEGYDQGEWILSDYGDFLVHVFSAKAREYYSLERLWRDAKDVPLPAE